MTIEEKIIVFVQRVRLWLSDQGERIVYLEENGKKKQDEWEQIMTFVEECDWVLTTVYDPTYYILKDDGVTPALNFLDWSDAEIEEFMSYWLTRWGVGESAAISVALETITILRCDQTTEGGGAPGFSGGLPVPPGGQAGDRLISIGNNQLGWEKPETVFDMGETN
jgi:hypothetical protein